ncbi:MAG: KOW domain-containing RNA-binding protein [Clostridia bacterium]|nr:KOW domain-containing RNA-binding protein [Clostridia bacterium]
MKVKTAVIGGICKSTQGRDKGRHYIISEIISESAVLAVDGNFKKLASPKKKNLKHIELLPESAESIGAKLLRGDKVFDTEIYSALKAYNCPVTDEEDKS